MSLPDKVRVMTLQEVFRTKKAIVCEFRYGINPGTFQLKDIVRWLKQKREYGKHGDAGHICLEICFD